MIEREGPDTPEQVNRKAASPSLRKAPNPDEYSISELAREFGTTSRTLWFYEDKGLIQPRRVGLQRIYTRRDHACLKLIVIGKKVGMSLREIETLLEIYHRPITEPEQLIAILNRINRHIELLCRRKSSIERAVRGLSYGARTVIGKLDAKR